MEKDNRNKFFFQGIKTRDLNHILHVGPTKVHGAAVDVVKNQLHVVTLEKRFSFTTRRC